MQLSPEQQKVIDQQKEQCIFCKIIKGEIPSKKVYEDDKVIAILDINPATKGHTLVMPKEHYPIMPLIPPEVFKHLFSKVKEIDRCIKEAMLCKENTIFIANGGAAGQQSTHFMLHIIPREKGDELEFLDIQGKEVPEEEIKEVMEKCQVLGPMLKKNLAILGFTEEGAGSGVPQKLSKEQLIQLIDTNPQLKQVMLQKPEEFKKSIPNHPQLKEIFKDFDVDEIIKAIKEKNQGKKEKKKIDLSGIE